MTFIPSASCGSMNSRSKRSIKISRFPAYSAYGLNSTTEQQSRADGICFKLSPIGSVMTHLSMPSVEMKKSEQRAFASHSTQRAHSEHASGDFVPTLRQQ